MPWKIKEIVTWDLNCSHGVVVNFLEKWLLSIWTAESRGATLLSMMEISSRKVWTEKKLVSYTAQGESHIVSSTFGVCQRLDNSFVYTYFDPSPQMRFPFPADGGPAVRDTLDYGHQDYGGQHAQMRWWRWVLICIFWRLRVPNCQTFLGFGVIETTHSCRPLTVASGTKWMLVGSGISQHELHVSLNHRFCSVLMLSHPFFLWFLYVWFVSCGITIKRRLLPDCLTHRSLLIVSGRW